MSENRKKSHSVLLRTEGKATHSFELFPASEWSQEIDIPTFRVRINNTWHSPTGKYSFITIPRVASLITETLLGTPIEHAQKPNIPIKADVKVHFEDYPYLDSGWIYTPPHQEMDGLWYVWVWVYSKGTVKALADNVTVTRIR